MNHINVSPPTADMPREILSIERAVAAERNKESKR